MNSRLWIAAAGIAVLLFGLAGLLAPQRVLGVLGLATLNASTAAATLGEVRATYGGLFTVMGAYALFAAVNPGARRESILLLGLLWLGAAAGRAFGVSVDGNPGVFGWLSLGVEVVIGGVLVLAAGNASAAS
jgi:hypothetical protein